MSAEVVGQFAANKSTNSSQIAMSHCVITVMLLHEAKACYCSEAVHVISCLCDRCDVSVASCQFVSCNVGAVDLRLDLDLYC